MRPFLILLAFATPVAAAPVCDPDAPQGDRDPLVGHYMCQQTRDGKSGDPYACEIMVRSGDNAIFLREAKLAIPCELMGSIAKGKLDGNMYCFATDDFLDEIAEVKGKLRSIPGGFAVETKTDVVRSRRVDPKATRAPFKTVNETDHVGLTLTVCRKPWPKGQKNEMEELEKHPPM